MYVLYSHVFWTRVLHEWSNVPTYIHSCACRYVLTTCDREPVSPKHLYRLPNMHTMRYLQRHFSPKSPIISCSFAKRDVQVKASCTSLPPPRNSWLRDQRCSSHGKECEYPRLVEYMYYFTKKEVLIMYMCCCAALKTLKTSAQDECSRRVLKTSVQDECCPENRQRFTLHHIT